jgi:hypothetical protein
MDAARKNQIKQHWAAEMPTAARRREYDAADREPALDLADLFAELSDVLPRAA